MRATFVFPNPRRQLILGIAAGTEPDSTLLGANHLDDHGVDVRIHDPLLTRRALPAPLDRVAWNVRELTVPFEIGATDVVFTPLANVLPIAARARRTPTVVVNYGLNLIHRRASGGRRALLDRSLRAAARIVCLGDSQRDELVERAGLAPGRVVTIPLPVDAEYFVPDNGDGTGGVLTVGKDLARDYKTFLAAVENVDTRVQLAVYERNLRGLVLPRNAEASQLSSLELRAAYAKATCVVLPQRRDDYAYGSEGGGLTALLEAMAMGKAVVATERAILRDYVEDGVDALIVPPEDPAALRSAIERVLGDPGLAARLGAAARARVERAHTTRGFAAHLAKLFRSVL